jgi:multiple sugar transport system substrate-binding protein
MFPAKRSLFVLVTLLLVLTACAQQAPAPAAAPAPTQAPAKAEAAPTAAPAAAKPAADNSCGELKMEDFTNAKIDWKAPAKAAPGGSITIHVAALSHPYINALRPYVPLFTELTGINVVYDILPVEEFWTKTAADLQGGTGFYDLIQNGTEFEWAYSEAGWTEDLNKFLNDPKLTDLEWYDVNDFYPADWAAHAWNGQYGIGTYGKGQQNAIPVNSEPLMLICNKDKLAKAGLAGPPKTWDEWAADAEKMTGNGEYGVVQRGSRDYSLMYGYAPGFFAYSKTDLDENGKPVYNCPECVKYTQLYGDTLRKFGPPGQTQIGWDMVVANMASGQVGCTIDDMAFADTYENAAKSKVAGKMIYGNPPAGPTGDIRIPVWYWAWSVNKKAVHPDAAWLFLQWATSKPVMKIVSACQHAMIPVRKSTWEGEGIMNITKDWGNYRDAVDKSRQYWGNFYTVSPQMVAMTGPWVVAIQETVQGDKTAKDALDAAVAESEKILKDAGFYEKLAAQKAKQ